jgi:tripartite-type tricarboxylate transporter receptor subunit TctC
MEDVVSTLSKALILVLLSTFSLAALAQSYPDRAVKLIVPLSTGSATDTLARLLAQKLSERWGQPVVVENQPGANGIIATEAVVKSPPDGYTLLMVAANHVINASLYRKLPFDTLKDIEPVSRVAYTALVLSVHPSVPARSVEEYIALAKSGKAKVNYGSAGNGSATHLAGEMFSMMTGAKIVHVPYKAISQAHADLLGGQIESVFMVLAAAIPQVKAGKVRALGVTSMQRAPQLPDVPTIDEAGVKGFDVISWIGLAAPAGTPAATVNRIHGDVAAITAQPDFRERVQGSGLEVALLGPADFKTFMAADQARWADVVKASGARLD